MPKEVLDAVRVASINFHPAPPAWPGVGCVSYALYHGDEEFGATAHLMLEKVDSGPIVRVIRFPIVESDDNESLSRRARDHSLILYYDVLYEISTGCIPVSDEQWHGPARTWAEFRRWMTLSPNDPPEEVHRKIRAVRHPHLPGPFVKIAEARFRYVDG